MEMRIEDEIPIEIDDDIFLTQIALVIDRPEIHKDLKEFRKKWQTKTQPTDLLSFMYTPAFGELELDSDQIVRRHKLPFSYTLIMLQVLFYWRVDTILNWPENVFGKSRKSTPTLLTKQGNKLLKIPLEVIHYKFIRGRKEIRKHRKWYWMWVNRGKKDYEGIVDDWNYTLKESGDSNYIEETNEVQQAVFRYHQALLSPLTLN